MENHPIPQDVTGFKFKLIGSVTLKQFLYLIGGGIIAAVLFMIPISGFIKYPLSFLFASVGVGIAFVPIDGRPMDVMMKNFFKALPAENQYIFRKRGAQALIIEFFTPQTVAEVKKEEVKTDGEDALSKKRALLYKTLKQSSKPDEREQAMLTNINSYLHETTTHSATPSIQNVDQMPSETSAGLQIARPIVAPTREISQPLQIVTPSVTIATKEIVQSTQQQQSPIAPPAVSLSPDPQVMVSVSQKIQDLDANTYSKIVTPTAASLPQMGTPVTKPAPTVQNAETQTFVVQQQQQENPLSTQKVPLTTTQAAPSGVNAIAPDQTGSVITVTQEKSLKAGFPELPDTPNIVMGIIKDPRGRIIPNILVEVMNQQGIPVRAFKTNALGQFAAATPLPNGEYTIILEDPRKQNEFEQIKIILKGEIFEPLEIISVDQREKLRRELFGSTAGAQAAGA